MIELPAGVSFLLKKYLFLWVLIINALIVVCVSALLPIRFEENDDICMLLISSGSYSGTPDAHLVFINYIYGLGLKQLYLQWQGVEWYTLSFVLLHIVSVSVLLSSVIRDIGNRVLRMLYVILFYSIEMQTLLHLQFTTTAAVVSLAGAILLLEHQPYRKILGVLLCVVGSLLRLEISLVVLFISFALFIRQIVARRKVRVSSSLVYLGVTIGLIGALEVVDQASYGKEGGWKTYVEYNKARGQINDNPNVAALVDKLPQGIKPVDYALLLRFFQDGTVLDSKKLNSISKSLAHVYFTDKLDGALYSLQLYKKYFLFIFTIALLLIIAIQEKVDRIIIVLTLILFTLVVWVMALVVSLKYRIFISAMLPLLYSFCKSAQRVESSFHTRMLSICLLLFCLYSADYVYQFIGQNKYLKDKIIEQQAFVAEYLSHSTNNIVPYAADYRTQGMPAFNVSAMHFKKRMFFGGWMTNIPLNAQHYTSHCDFTRGLSLFLRQESRPILLLLAEGIYTNYGVRVTPVIVAESENDMIVEFRVN